MDKNVLEIAKSCVRIRQIRFVFEQDGWHEVARAIDNFCDSVEAAMRKEGWR